MRARRPRIVALHLVDAPAGALGVTAIINDGGLVDYPIAVDRVLGLGEMPTVRLQRRLAPR